MAAKKKLKKSVVVSEPVAFNPDAVLSTERSRSRWHWWYAGLALSGLLVGATALVAWGYVAAWWR